MSTHEEQRISKLLDYPYGSFLMIRLEYMLICGDELEAKILRLVEIDMDAKRRTLYQEYMADLPKGNVPTDQVIDISRDVWVSISYRSFTYDLYGTVKSDNTLKRAIKSLVDKGLLSKRYTPARQYDAPEYQINTTKVQEEFAKLKQCGKSGYQKLIPSKSDTIKNSHPQELIPSGGQNLIPSGGFRVSNFDTNSRIENTVDITVESNEESVGSIEHNTPSLSLQEMIALLAEKGYQISLPTQGSEQSDARPTTVGEPHHSQQDGNAHQDSAFSPPLPGENAPDAINASIASSQPQAPRIVSQSEIEPLSTSKQASYSRENTSETPEQPTSRQKPERPATPRARKPPVEKPAPPAQPDLSQLSEQEQQVYAMLRAEDKPKYLAYSPAKREVYNNWLGSYGFAVSVDITPKFDECLNRAIHIHPSAEDFKNWRATLKKQDNEKLPEKRYFKNRNPQIWDVMRDIASLREMIDTVSQGTPSTNTVKATMTHDEACKLAYDINKQGKDYGYNIQAQASTSKKDSSVWVVRVKWENEDGFTIPAIKSLAQWQAEFDEMHKALSFVPRSMSKKEAR